MSVLRTNSWLDTSWDVDPYIYSLLYVLSADRTIPPLISYVHPRYCCPIGRQCCRQHQRHYTLKDLITVFAHPCRFRLEALRWKSLWWYFFSDNLQNSCYTINCGMISYNRSTLHGDVGMISFSHSVSWYIPRDILHSLVARWGWDVVIQFTLFPDTLLLTTFACIKLFRLWTQPV